MRQGRSQDGQLHGIGKVQHSVDGIGSMTGTRRANTAGTASKWTSEPWWQGSASARHAI
jgi:hypothetical protein